MAAIVLLAVHGSLLGYSSLSLFEQRLNSDVRLRATLSAIWPSLIAPPFEYSATHMYLLLGMFTEAYTTATANVTGCVISTLEELLLSLETDGYAPSRGLLQGLRCSIAQPNTLNVELDEHDMWVAHLSPPDALHRDQLQVLLVSDSFNSVATESLGSKGQGVDYLLYLKKFSESLALYKQVQAAFARHEATATLSCQLQADDYVQGPYCPEICQKDLVQVDAISLTNPQIPVAKSEICKRFPQVQSLICCTTVGEATFYSPNSPEKQVQHFYLTTLDVAVPENFYRVLCALNEHWLHRKSYRSLEGSMSMVIRRGLAGETDYENVQELTHIDFVAITTDFLQWVRAQLLSQATDTEQSDTSTGTGSKSSKAARQLSYKEICTSLQDAPQDYLQFLAAYFEQRTSGEATAES